MPPDMVGAICPAAVLLWFERLPPPRWSCFNPYKRVLDQARTRATLVVDDITDQRNARPYPESQKVARIHCNG
jgi:hypothetical protein